VRPTLRSTAGRRWPAAIVLAAIAAAGCDNSPYPKKDEGENVYYSSFTTEPAHLDPGCSYSSGDYNILCNIVEPPFQYHFLKRPYELIPALAVEVPKPEPRKVTFDGNTYDQAIAYTIRIKPALLYQDHPCFVEANRRLTEKDVRGIDDVWDFEKDANREVVAGDFVHAIRRFVDPRLACPLYSTFAKNFLGMAEYRKLLDDRIEAARAKRKAAAGVLYNREQDEKFDPIVLDYADGAEEFPFVREIDRHTFEIVLQKPYPIILYWMALPFFAPVPPEAVAFFNQRPLLQRSITFDRNPVGTGAYVLRRFDPTNEIVLERNGNFRLERYPDPPSLEGADAATRETYEQMRADGVFDDAGKRLPMIDRIVYRMEKESIPRWSKFLQGYYDYSGIQADSFDQAVKLSSQGESELTDELVARGVRLLRSPGVGFYFYAFNMTDPVVGGFEEKQRKLRHAISIAFDTEEQIAIFDNGMTIPSHSPIPPGVFGYDSGPEGINPVVYRWDAALGKPVRRSLEEARRLLAEAGYPDGYGPDGKPLTIKFSTPRGRAEGRSGIRFVRKQFDKLNIRLVVDAADGNRHNEKVLSGSFQFVHWGWHGDYPDPENFLFLFYAPDPNDPKSGQTVPKYYSPEFNRLFNEMKAMTNGPERMRIIRRMLHILRTDAPAIFKNHPVSRDLVHGWLRNAWPHGMTGCKLKYHRIDEAGRQAYRRAHNAPRWWPVAIVAIVLGVSMIPAAIAARRRLREG